jgi:UDPglucose 6-dehydrogenase
MDINAPDFNEKFDPKNGTVGVIGHGYVGHAVEVFFHQFYNPQTSQYDKLFDVLIYDKAKPDLDTLEDVVKKSELIFVCVPTPMRRDGSCHTGIIESVLQDVANTAESVGRDPRSFVIIMKSTVYPGFTDKMKARFPKLRLLFSPEFLTEKNSIEDFEKCNRIFMGGDIEDVRVAFKYYEARLYERLMYRQVVFAQCEPKVAEMAKLYANGILATKILFSNEVFQVCQKLGIDYEEVRTLACLDERIGSSHTSVPGHDGQLGYGGHCFPKDLQNLRAVARQLGVDEKIFTAVIERNDELREDKDWLKMKGRAVIDE